MRRWTAVAFGCGLGSVVCWVAGWLIRHEVDGLRGLRFDDDTLASEPRAWPQEAT